MHRLADNEASVYRQLDYNTPEARHFGVAADTTIRRIICNRQQQSVSVKLSAFVDGLERFVEMV